MSWYYKGSGELVSTEKFNTLPTFDELLEQIKSKHFSSPDIRVFLNVLNTSISPEAEEISGMIEGVEKYTLTELKRGPMVRFVVTDLTALPNEFVLDRA